MVPAMALPKRAACSALPQSGTCPDGRIS